MTIAKGQAWGVVSPLPDGAPVVQADSALARLLGAGVECGVPAIVGLEGGAIWELLGGPTLHDRLRSGGAFTFPIDLAVVSTSEHGDVYFVNHVIAHTRCWTRGVAVLNGQRVGGLRLGHRSHVNDGALDLTKWDLGWGELWSVRRRALAGAHTPHPRIQERRVRHYDVVLDRVTPTWADGVALGSASGFSVRVIPDAGFVVA